MGAAQTGADGYIERWRPVLASAGAASFARAVVQACGPHGRERARNLLWAAGRLADWGIPLGLAPAPEVLLHPSVIERFTAHAPGLTGVTRRTLRTNLRFVARAVVPQLQPADAPLPRERARAPYSPAEIDGYLALADAQPTAARRMRAAGLVCLGAGAGLIRADLRAVRGTDICCRSGGVIVGVRGGRPRVVPVLARYHDVLLESAQFAGGQLITGGTDPQRHNITTPLVAALAGGTGLPRLDTSRLRATWLADCAQLIGLATFLHTAGITCSQRLGDITAAPGPGGEAEAVALLGRAAVSIPLAAAESITDASGIALRIEVLLPIGVRHRQLRVRTLILGMLLALASRRPAFLTEVHEALTALPADDQARLGVTEEWKTGPHLLTYRQVERTFHLVVKALSNDEPDGAPTDVLASVLDDLLEASIPPEHKDASTALAVDWTDVETFARPPRRGTTKCADPEASWGHRTSNLPGPKGEMFFGFYLSAGTMTREENGPPVPELARRMTLTSCRLDPARALAAVLLRMAAAGIRPGDILDDSGYAHRDAEAWAIPLRRAGAQLIQDLHPHDRGPRGTHHGAIIANGNLYCPATPKPLLELGPLAPAATSEQVAAHDQQAAELSRHKLGRISADDADGYHRVMCPAVMGKIRCPHRPSSMKLDRGRPEILTPPANPPACCHQQTITVPPQIAAKTRQKHDYPSPAHRRSYARRTGAERTFATIKDPATTSIARGWCRLTGLTPLALWLACLFTVRNQRILTAYNARQAGSNKRAAAGLPPKTRKRRRTTLASLTAGPP